MRSFRFSRFSGRVLITGIVVAAVAATTTVALAGSSNAASTGSTTPRVTAGCTSATCTYTLFTNPGLGAGKPFACPAMAHASAKISVTNRFRRDALNDTMTLTAHGLPPNTGFDLFLVTNSAFDTGFTTFGFGWYQSDVESNSHGNASVSVRGIFDHETFVLNPPTTVERTNNVGFWFDSPSHEASVCHSAAPAATPFNGEQNAGLLAMITKGAPLGLIH
jgi:hypothetical protein